MALSAIPPTGLALSELPANDNTSKRHKLLQAAEVGLPPSLVDDVLRSARGAKDSVHAVLGKNPVIIVGNKKAPLNLIPRPGGLLYHKGPAGEFKLDLSARLDLQTPDTDALDLNDPALLALQSGYAKHAQHKQSNTTVFVKDSSKLAPARRGKQPPRSGPVSSLGSHRVGLFGDRKNVAQSLPASPSSNAHTQNGASTPNPLKPSPKQEALKAALIHLLAVRPVSRKYVVATLRCSAEEIEKLLDKYGRPARIDNTKLDLSERGYKELDIWRFNYSDADRKAVVERAISAFDKMRLTHTEKEWQMLLPKAERGKGTCLSRLQLHKGPMDRVRTPKINIDGAERAVVATTGDGSGDDQKGRLAPPDAARPRSQDPIKKRKLGEVEARSKRLPSKKPKRTHEAATDKRDQAVDSAQKTEASVQTSNGTAEKKGRNMKSVGTAGQKFKSSEFVHDSDEEDDTMDLLSPAMKPALPKPAPRTKVEPSPGSKSSGSARPSPAPRTTTNKEPGQAPKASAKAIAPSTAKDQPGGKAIAAAKRTGTVDPASAPKASTAMGSVFKGSINTYPSPTGQSTVLSPALTALSGFGLKPSNQTKVVKKVIKVKKVESNNNNNNNKNNNNNNSHIKQPLAPRKITTKPPATTATRYEKRVPDNVQASVPMSKSLSQTRKTSSPIKPSPLASSPPISASDVDEMQGVESSKSSSSSTPLANKRTEAGRMGTARPAKKPLANTSDGNLKRKAKDMELDVHRRGGANVTTDDHADKRQRAAAMSPPASDPTDSSGNTPRVISQEQLDYARSFKTQHAKYAAMRAELAKEEDPAPEKVEKLNNMYQKLKAHKADLWKMGA